jgi:hypothetical protein
MNPFEQENSGFPTSINEKPLSVKDWVITLIIVAIPLVGIIMLLGGLLTIMEMSTKRILPKVL